jgi:hypothetical protein
MNRLIVKSSRPIGLVDLTGIEPYHFFITQKDIDAGKTFKVPDNSFFRGKINEGLLEMVGEEKDEEAPTEEVHEKRGRPKREK